ncbi:hypothetical protein MPRG_65500 [Mycobacterium paragordonae]|uniref:Cold-shock protein n=1 Tax=Mycobacterium paragordonae TaxID=1389713 RepID=A0ABQ1CGA3_9MYCO|nr:hypothetical protein MPRG_65500 [Mycobacterium paragordonae]
MDLSRSAGLHHRDLPIQEGEKVRFDPVDGNYRVQIVGVVEHLNDGPDPSTVGMPSKDDPDLIAAGNHRCAGSVRSAHRASLADQSGHPPTSEGTSK